MSFTKTQNKFSKGIDDKADGTAVTIDETGNVGIGMDPKTVTFDLSAKEQLKEWKTKAKTSTWSEVTDGEFSQEPTEELVEQWVETRAAGDKLQVKGNGSFSNTITSAASDWTDGTSSGTRMSPGSGLFSKNPSYAHLTCYNEGVGNAYTVAEILKNGAANFSGTVTADKINSFIMGVGLSDTFTLNGKTQPNYGINWEMTGNAPVGMSGYFGLSFATAGAERFSIAGSGNISTKGSGNNAPQLNVTNVGTGTSYLRFNDTETTASAGRYIGSSGDNMVFGNWGVAEHMRITDDGMLMVGRTSYTAAATDNGIQMYPSGIVYQFTSASDASDMHRWHNSAGVLKTQIKGNGDILTEGTVTSTRMLADRVVQDGAPVVDAKGLINTLSTLRKATKDETTLEGMRDALADAIGGLIENLEHEIAAMPAPEVGTMDITE